MLTYFSMGQDKCIKVHIVCKMFKKEKYEPLFFWLLSLSALFKNKKIISKLVLSELKRSHNSRFYAVEMHFGFSIDVVHLECSLYVTDSKRKFPSFFIIWSKIRRITFPYKPFILLSYIIMFRENKFRGSQWIENEIRLVKSLILFHFYGPPCISFTLDLQYSNLSVKNFGINISVFQVL